MYGVGRGQGGLWGRVYQCHTFQPRIQCQPVYDNQSPFIRNITSTLRVHYEYITSTLRVHYEYSINLDMKALLIYFQTIFTLGVDRCHKQVYNISYKIS
jgi:hypothetical protein